MCFKMFADFYLTFKTAEASCEREGAKLVSLSGISVQAITSYLGMEVNHTYWIGLSYDERTQQLSWVNGWPMTISNWGKNEPPRITSETCFMSAADGYWRSAFCYDERPYICQITAGKPPIPKTYTGDCPNTSKLWIPTEGRNCHIYESAQVDWFTAKLRCFRYGGYLISIHSLEELEQIKKSMPQGLVSVLIGLMRSDEGGFSWTDHTPVDFINWEENQPKDGDDKCVAMMSDTLKWRVVPCQGKMQLLCVTKKIRQISGIPEIAKFSNNSNSGVTTGAIAGILVSVLLVLLVLIVLVIVFFRSPNGRNHFRNPFGQNSVNYENALYNVDPMNLEFQEGLVGDIR